MVYIGVDVHGRQWVICVIDERGKELIFRTIYGGWREGVRFIAGIEGPKVVVFEASCGMGWVYDRLREVCDRVVVADPGKLAATYKTKRKNDKIDARRLAKLLLIDGIPEVYVARIETRAWRALIGQRRSVVVSRTAIKNRIKALLREHGKEPGEEIWTKAGRKWLEGLEFKVAVDKHRLGLLLAELDRTQASLSETTKVLDGMGAGDEQVARLMTVPGIGIRTAEAVVAYVEEAKRFGHSKGVGSYFGLVPEQDQSGETNRLGRITRRGPSVVRWLLVEAAWQGIRKSARLREMYNRFLRGQPSRRKIAIVAVAHFLARALVAMLKNGEDWKEAA